MTLTITEEGIGTEEIVFEDFDIPIPCHFYDRCQSKAQFKYLRTCCGKVIFFCADCNIHFIQEMNKDAGTDMFYCVECNTMISDLNSWLKYIGRV